MKAISLPRRFFDPRDSAGKPGSAESTLDRERRYWGKGFLKLWGALYAVLWIVLTSALLADNAYVQSALLAALLAFFSSLLFTLLFAAPIITITRFRRGVVCAEEKLLAVVFLMILLFVFPLCWISGFGWPTALALSLVSYQGLALLSRHSKFREKLQGGTAARLFPTDKQ